MDEKIRNEIKGWLRTGIAILMSIIVMSLEGLIG